MCMAIAFRYRYCLYWRYDQLYFENELYHKEYVANYTNAAYIVVDDFTFDDGMFSGYDEKTSSYDKTKWAFKTDDEGKGHDRILQPCKIHDVFAAYEKAFSPL